METKVTRVLRALWCGGPVRKSIIVVFGMGLLTWAFSVTIGLVNITQRFHLVVAESNFYYAWGGTLDDREAFAYYAALWPTEFMVWTVTPEFRSECQQWTTFGFINNPSAWELPAFTSYQDMGSVRIPLGWFPVISVLYVAYNLADKLTRPHRSENFCKLCKSNLTGNTSGGCPKCGTTIDAVVPLKAKTE